MVASVVRVRHPLSLSAPQKLHPSSQVAPSHLRTCSPPHYLNTNSASARSCPLQTRSLLAVDWSRQYQWAEPVVPPYIPGTESSPSPLLIICHHNHHQYSSAQLLSPIIPLQFYFESNYYIGGRSLPCSHIPSAPSVMSRGHSKDT